ncbi:hypothetical protein ACET3Z_007915 [Daucus carota]
MNSLTGIISSFSVYSSLQMVSALGSKILFIGFLISTLACFVTMASGNYLLEDFCVADVNSKVGGGVCKDPNLVTENDFFVSGFDIPANTANAVGSVVTGYNVSIIPGLNTLGVSLARIDFAPFGLNAPHTHPRGTEIFTVIEGTLRAGFITANPRNRHFTKILNKGDVFVFPRGLVHYQQNLGNSNALAIAATNSDNPGAVTLANVVFGAKPDISVDTIAKAFQLDKNIVTELQARF